jgi:hypothetical protein
MVHEALHENAASQVTEDDRLTKSVTNLEPKKSAKKSGHYRSVAGRGAVDLTPNHQNAVGDDTEATFTEQKLN